jgi:hypothetical protein
MRKFKAKAGQNRIGMWINAEANPEKAQKRKSSQTVNPEKIQSTCGANTVQLLIRCEENFQERAHTSRPTCRRSYLDHDLLAAARRVLHGAWLSAGRFMVMDRAHDRGACRTTYLEHANFFANVLAAS